MINATEKVGSRIDIPLLEPDFVSFLKNSPVALFNVMLRPLPGDLNSMIMIPAFFENMLIWLLIVFTAIFFRKKIPGEHIPLIIFCLSFVVILFILTGLTTPVIGAIVRYKAPALPFLFALMFLLMDKDKILRYLPKRKSK
jgi:drug/metabolite transporter (DMT)-like permease